MSPPKTSNGTKRIYFLFIFKYLLIILFFLNTCISLGSVIFASLLDSDSEPQARVPSLKTAQFFLALSVHSVAVKFCPRQWGFTSEIACRSPMADHEGESESAMESVMEKITAKLHGHDSPSSSDSEDGKKSLVEAVKSKSYRLFGREKPLHKVLGGGKRMATSLSI